MKNKLLQQLDYLSKRLQGKELTEEEIQQEVKVVRDEKAKGRTRY